MEAAESSTPAPNDMMAAMARCGSCTISPSIVPPSRPDAAANPQQNVYARIASDSVTELIARQVDRGRCGWCVGQQNFGGNTRTQGVIAAGVDNVIALARTFINLIVDRIDDIDVISLMP